ncbi:MAG: hypothetical protein AAF488_00165 [Planctomycetota bacterium]
MRTPLLAAATFAAAVLLAPSVGAQADMVGKSVSGFRAGTMVNEVDAKSLEDCMGEVVLVKYWGTR